jgi:predicted lactoylglutathione lyase
MSQFETYPSAAVALPIGDRRRSHDFYTHALGLEPVGEVAEDDLPEPLMLRVNAGLVLVLIPARGFSWVIGGRQVGGTECLMSIEQASPDAVRALVARAAEAGAEVVTEPTEQPWGFEGTFADPDGHLWTVAVRP